MFPKSKQFILDHFDNQACYYLGNVINSEQLLNTEDIIQLKQVSNSVIFIGNKKYINGAKSLVNACNLYNQKNKQSIVVNIIGLTKEELLIEDNSSIHFHGYLDKGNKEQSLKYYQLLKEAKVIINTTENWGGFSSMTEAMYHYTPVITTPYSEFVETYGEKLTCGFYASSQEELLNSIETIFSADIKQYNQYCYAANDLVKDFTWDNYIERFLKIITQ